MLTVHTWIRSYVRSENYTHHAHSILNYFFRLESLVHHSWIYCHWYWYHWNNVDRLHLLASVRVLGENINEYAVLFLSSYE